MPEAPPQLPSHAARDSDPRLEALRAAGAPQRDPSGFASLEALARRTAHYRGAARQHLEARLAQALADLEARLGNLPQPQAAIAVDTMDTAKSYGPDSPLAALLRDLAARPATALQPAAPDVTPIADEAQALPELKALDYFRDSWSQLSVEQQYAQAMAQAPDNAGPLNSHLLILRALQCMRDISPDYLHRFIAYADTLVWLDQATGGSLPSSRPAVRESNSVGETRAKPQRKPAAARKRQGG